MKKEKFVTAYMAMYGGTKYQALRAWYEADIEYIDVIISTFDNESKKAFYND